MQPTNHDVFDAIVRWEWSLGPVVVCGLSTLLAVMLPWRLATSDPTPGVRAAIWLAGGERKRIIAWTAGVAIGSGVIVAYQIVDDDWPTLIWLGAGFAAITLCHIWRSDRSEEHTSEL